jgi:SAM-dependent methyltransferase
VTAHEDYFVYLRGRSLSGLVYRKLWLYPRLRRLVKGRVLDVGSGIGDFLANRPGTVGVDVNPLLVEWCRGRGLDAFVMKDGALPFPDRSFDAVMLDNVLEHIAEPLPLLAEIRRVLLPDGVVVVGVPGVKGFAADPDHKVFYDEQSLTRVLERSSFTCTRVLHMPIDWRFLSRRLRQYCLYGVFRRDARDS